MDKTQLRLLVENVLRGIGKYSEDAVNLIMGTIAQESRLGKYIRQLGNGPALGICQMEPATFEDIRKNYLYYKPTLFEKIMKVCNLNAFKVEDLEWNIAFAIAMCRVHYLRVPEVLPTTMEGYARYWKKYYNTPLGKGVESEFIYNYKKYLL